MSALNEKLAAPARPRPVAIRESVAERDFSGQVNLFNGDSVEHLLFDLHALGTYTSQFGDKTLPLLPKQQSFLTRHARHTFLNVYRRLFTVVFVLNFLLALPILISKFSRGI